MASQANGNITLIIANYLYAVKTKVLIHKSSKQQGKKCCAALKATENQEGNTRENWM